MRHAGPVQASTRAVQAANSAQGLTMRARAKSRSQDSSGLIPKTASSVGVGFAAASLSQIVTGSWVGQSETAVVLPSAHARQPMALVPPSGLIACSFWSRASMAEMSRHPALMSSTTRVMEAMNHSWRFVRGAAASRRASSASP